MLKSISWQEFILTIAVLIGFYYVITTLLLYSTEIVTIFRQKRLKLTTTGKHKDQNDSVDSNGLLGRAKYESGEQNAPRTEDTSSESISVAPSKEFEETISVCNEEHPDEKLLLTISELCNEIKSLVEITSSGDKTECVTLFQTLLSNYPQLVGTNDQKIINQIIYDECKAHCEFQIELYEINSLWIQSETPSNNKQ